METLKKIAKKSLKAEKTCPKKFLVMGGTRTHVPQQKPN